MNTKSSSSSKSHRPKRAGAQCPVPVERTRGGVQPQFPRVSQRFPSPTAASAWQKTKNKILEPCLELGKCRRRPHISVDASVRPHTITSARLRPLLSAMQFHRQFIQSGCQWYVSPPRSSIVAPRLMRSLNATAVVVLHGPDITESGASVSVTGHLIPQVDIDAFAFGSIASSTVIPALRWT